MKVKCIKSGAFKFIENGRVYEATGEWGDCYKIETEEGEKFYLKNRFEIVKEPKFKIGDKVVLIKYGNTFRIDKITKTSYEIVGINNKISASGIISFEFEDELKLYEEVNDMEKSFKEVIKDIKKEEVWVSDFKEITMTKYGTIIVKNIEGGMFETMTFDVDSKYKLKRNKVSFTEAFKSVEEENKEIESCITNLKIRQGNEENRVEFLCKGGLSWHETTQDVLHVTIEEALGEWYINV